MDYKIVEGELILLERVCIVNENYCTDKTST
jgi:hypothetical protein